MLPKRQSCNYGSLVSKNKLLDKKVPENPRYKHVKPVVDSGNNIRKYIDALKESHRTNLYRMDEVFCRIKLSAFVRLAVEVATRLPTDEQRLANSTSNPKKSEKKVEEADYQSVLVGVGELDLQNLRKNPKKSLPEEEQRCEAESADSPYLLLDVRCPEEYMQWHIITAKNYPYTMLSRSPRYETKDLLLYKNVPDKLIILYDEDESLAPRVATTLVQRGYDNIYVLTGGLKLASEKFPDGLIDGAIPVPSRKSAAAFQPRVAAVLKNQRPDNKFTEDDIFKLKRAMDLYFLPVDGPSAMNEPIEKRVSTVRSDFHKPQLSKIRHPPWK